MQKRSDAEWQQLLSEYQQSGLSQQAFCRQKKICPKGLIRYKRRSNPVVAKTGFIQVTPPKPRTDDSVKVELGALTLYLPLAQPLKVAQLIKALQ